MERSVAEILPAVSNNHQQVGREGSPLVHARLSLAFRALPTCSLLCEFPSARWLVVGGGEVQIQQLITDLEKRQKTQQKELEDYQRKHSITVRGGPE